MFLFNANPLHWMPSTHHLNALPKLLLNEKMQTKLKISIFDIVCNSVFLNVQFLVLKEIHDSVRRLTNSSKTDLIPTSKILAYEIFNIRG